MRNSVYQINKGINKPIAFKGLKAQYIGYLGGGVIVLLLLFTLLYAMGLHAFLCLGIILAAGVLMTSRIYRFSNTYGQYGMMKKIARRRVPDVVTSFGRALFRGEEKNQDA